MDSFFLCMCVCVRERTREKERDSLKPQWHIKTLRTFPFSKIALPWNANIFWRIPLYRCAALWISLEDFFLKKQCIQLLRACFAALTSIKDCTFRLIFTPFLIVAYPGGRSDYFRCPLASAVDAPKLNLGSDAVVVLFRDGRNTNTQEMTHNQHIAQRFRFL